VLNKYPDDKAKIKFKMNERRLTKKSIDHFVPFEQQYRAQRLLSLLRDDVGEFFQEYELDHDHDRNSNNNHEKSDGSPHNSLAP